MTGRRAIWLVGVVLLWCSNAYADVLLVISQDTPVYTNFYRQFVAELDSNNISTGIDIRLAKSIDDGEDLRHYRMIIAAGVDSAKAVAGASMQDVHVIYTMMPASSFDWLRINNMVSTSYQVLYIDQPLERLLGLVKLALPEVRHLGYVYGEADVANLERLRKASGRSGFKLHEASLHGKSRLVQSLVTDLSESEVVLVQPDPYLFNRRTVQSVLLASYRLRIPLIAYSESFVKSGALMSLFSTAEQLGKHTAELYVCKLEDCEEYKDVTYYPRYFTIEVNPLVARQLGLTLKSGDEFTHLLQGQVTQQKPASP